ncbi:MAG TPA: prepilin-type N-terminal cleavage/methylation domain-containing protein [Acidimicrobiales bacterium]|nr:prepilin-type N-terminal cleavage/methylation domain-containing protein [Acidimicrobiales bacterium]
MLKSTLARLREARSREFEGEEVAEAGFTLIELMVVLLIIAILLAIAIPTFLGVTGSANDRAAQSNLTNALTEIKALYQNSQSYAVLSIPAAQLASSAPEFTWEQTASVPSANKGTNTISEQPVDVQTSGDGLGVILATWAKGTNTCWYAVDLESAPVAAIAPADANQFVSATTGANGETAGGAAITQAGVYYSKVINPPTSGTGAGCNASNPITAGPWAWASSYSTAPAS